MARASKKSSDYHNLEKRSLEQILDNLPDPLFVTDPEGNVLLSNSATALTLDMSLDQLMKSNMKDLVRKGYYNKSYGAEAAGKKSAVSGLITTKLNLTYITTSTPVLDENGKVQLIITMSRPRELIDKYTSREDREVVNQRKREIEYLRNCVLETDVITVESKVMRQTLLRAHTLAQTDATAVLYGESGTGKELFAKYIHRHSKRAKEAFIAVNCAALPEHLVESELFGYERGAFTGANLEGKVGLFEAAQRGTLFLDEIAELPLALQSKLLRVLETGEVRRLGSNSDRKIDFRLITATHRDLKKMTEEGTFRSDLYYRLNVIPISIPPLRERPEDITVLALQFLAEFNKKHDANVEFDEAILEAFREYSWPGNIRELRNVVERKVISDLQDFSPDLVIPSAVAGQTSNLGGLLPELSGSLKEVMEKAEEFYISHVLKECDGRIGKAAERLGIYRTVLYRKLKAFEKKKAAKIQE